jgi:tape measure domain-containing protein
MLTKEVSTLSGFSRQLTNLFAFSFAGVGISQLTGLLDTIQQLNDRLKITEGSVEAAGVRMVELSALASRTNQSIDAVATAYVRLANATSGTGISAQALIGISETLINTFRLSGATTTETVNTLIQLSQAFSSGELRGQELRSVMEQNAIVARILRKEFGSEVYKKAEEGAISLSKFLGLLLKDQKEITEEAAKLGPTFEQSNAKALNSIKLSLNELNKSVGLNVKYANALETVIKNLDLLGTVLLGIVAIPLAPYFINGAKALAVFVGASNPVVLAMTAITAAFLSTFDSIDDFKADIKLFTAELYEVPKAIKTVIEWFLLLNPLTTLFGLAFSKAFPDKLFDNLKRKSQELREEVAAFYRTREDLARNTGPNAPTDTLAEIQEFFQKEALDKIAAKSKKVVKDIDVIKEAIRELNKSFMSGSLTASEYYDKINQLELSKLNVEFQNGTVTIEKYRKEVLELQALEIARDYNQNRISLEEFNRQIESNKLAQLRLELDSGKKSWQDYRQEVDKVSTALDPSGLIAQGSERYLRSIGSLAEQIKSSIEGVFKSLEDSLVDFIQTGTQDWRKFTQFILDEITRIVVRQQIIRPLVSGIQGYADSFASPVQGGEGTLIPGTPSSSFITPGTTIGKLGPSVGGQSVSQPGAGVTVNVINNANADVEQQESTGPNGERVLDLIITSRVREGIASGAFDNSFSSAYGIRRKGF